MDIFAYRDNLIPDYRAYVESILEIKDVRGREVVLNELSNGALWTDPLIPLNPDFKPGAWIDDLVRDGVWHETCARVFRSLSS